MSQARRTPDEEPDRFVKGRAAQVSEILELLAGISFDARHLDGPYAAVHEAGYGLPGRPTMTGRPTRGSGASPVQASIEDLRQQDIRAAAVEATKKIRAAHDALQAATGTLDRALGGRVRVWDRIKQVGEKADRLKDHELKPLHEAQKRRRSRGEL